MKVRAGEIIPGDGIILNGRAHIDEAMINGEPIPQKKSVGDRVVGGTINQDGLLIIQATSPAADSFLAKIISAVDIAQQSKAPSQRLADKISRIFVPTVIAIALVTLVIWLTIGSTYLGWNQALRLGIICFVSVLTIACPCALGLATPAAVMAGIGAASRKGILIKSAEAIESMAKIDTIVFDKTGTITSGKPTVSEVTIKDKKYSKDDILAIAAGLEAGSAHPLAKAIINKARQNNISAKKVVNIKVNAGSGVQGTIDENIFSIGRPDPGETEEGPTATIVSLKKSGDTIALINIEDSIKPEAKSVLIRLKKRGIYTIMLSGDRLKTARHIATGLSINKVVADVSPLEKANYIKKIKDSGRNIAMVGDGINDAVAMTTADIGIAMDNGSDIALESAQIALLRGDLNLLVMALDISSATEITMKKNLFWAFFYNIISIPLAAGLLFPVFSWLLRPEIAALAMSLSSITVIGSALHLKRRFR
jgi:heavy metal translocating P-type ATPase